MKTFAFKPITYYRVAMWFFVVATMCAIFFFSAQTGEQSAKTSEKIVTVIENQFVSSQPATTTSSDVSSDTSSEPQTPIKNNNLILTIFVRKVAHVLIFAALGFFLYGVICSYNGKRTIKLLVSIAVGILYAATDELHQYFIQGRNATIKDVFIDSCGIVIGVCFMLFVVFIIKSIKEAKHSAVS